MMKHKIEPGLEVTIRGVEYTVDSVTGKPPVVILRHIEGNEYVGSYSRKKYKLLAGD